MTVTLEPMDQETFETYYAQSLESYAHEHVKAGNWREDEALQRAKEQFGQLLPDGLATKEHYLFNVMHDNESIGIVWLHIRHQKKQAFIFDIELNEAERGKGYGKETMKTVDEFAQSKGMTEIRLHVFAHNRRAIALYENMGYEMTDHQMLKQLS